jgi:hypothetical protein
MATKPGGKWWAKLSLKRVETVVRIVLTVVTLIHHW